MVAISRVYAASVDEVWDALTNPERIPRWFLPVSGELRLGGTYQFEGNAGGEIRVCEPPRRLQVTWVMGEAPGPEDSSIVEARLEPEDDGTRFTLEHTAVFPAEFWATYGPGAVGVRWDLALVALVAHLSGEVIIGDPATLETDPKIRAANTASSEAWGEAFLQAGADAETVDRNVSATTAFYVPPID